MAEYVAFNLIHDRKKRKIPGDYGFIPVSLYSRKIYNSSKVLIEIKEWIEENIGDKWSYWHFETKGDQNKKGISFAFKLEEDLMAFKLRWS